MYIPSSFRVSDLAELHQHIRRYSFATLVTQGEAGLSATHLPLLLDSDSGRYGRLLGHVARANPQWRDVREEALVIFPGPHAYISASWYETSGTVPTWNYTTVHAYGAIEIIEDGAAVHDILKRLAAAYEAAKQEPWSYDDTDLTFDKMRHEIVAFQIEISRLEGKYKLNQNHPPERRLKVIEALQAKPDDDSQAIARMMQATLESSSTTSNH